MLLEIGILFATYTSVRLLKNMNLRLNNGSRIKLIKYSQNNSRELLVTDTKQDKHYLKISAVAMGLTAVGQWIYPPLMPLGLGIYIYATLPYMRQVEKALVKQRKINVDVMFFTADLMTLAINQYFAAAFCTFLFYEGRLIIAKVKKESEKTLINVFDQKPRNVWVLQNNAEMEIPLEQVKVNDILVVNAGEVVAVDGMITEGMATIDQHAFTGESQPVEKERGDRVFASTLVVAGKIQVTVEKSGENTTIAKIGQVLMRSTHFKSTIQLKGERWAEQATFPMLALGSLVLFTLGTVNAIVFIYSHIGNRIRILAPLGTLSHISVASHKSILVKDGRSIEQLIKVDTVLFDKTGTLTNEQPKVGQIITCDNYKAEDILAYAAAAERKLSHPIAKAILKKAEEENLSLPDIDDSKYQIGYGITVRLDNKMIQVGSVRFMTKEGISIPENIEATIAHSQSDGHSLVVVAVDHQVVGLIELQASVRTEVKQIISGLRQRGIEHIAIVSGDHQQPTQKLAEELGMDGYFSEVLPQHKAQIVEQLQKEGKSVCFVGDGINDTIAMKKANVSISLSGATSIAIDMADIVLMDGSLSHLCDLFDLSKSLNANLRKSLVLSLVPGVVNLSSALLLHFGIVISIIITNLFFTLGVKNAVSPLKQINGDKAS